MDPLPAVQNVQWKASKSIRTHAHENLDELGSQLKIEIKS